ncbi:MAG: gamma-glutamyltransferase [Luteitalea sp.]|nr:gamma-glutamyltransferase [Luteitalea sp.]
MFSWPPLTRLCALPKRRASTHRLAMLLAVSVLLPAFGVADRRAESAEARSAKAEAPPTARRGPASGVGSGPRAPVHARHGMVGSTEGHASQAGIDILKRGGNAIDAAVAVGFALAVTHPAAGNLGGGGFMLIRLADGKTTAIDYREMAPARASRDMFLDAQGNVVADRSRIGPLAAGVPGSVAGLVYAQEKYGRLPLADLIQPAIDLAEQGFVVSEALADSLSNAKPRLVTFPASARVFLENGEPYGAGDRLVQRDLARTLRLIAKHGAEGFYRGPVAELIEAEMKRTGGLITKADLSAYRPVEREPLHGSYRDVEIIGMPPPSSGGVALIQLLNILDAYPIQELGHNSPKTMHLMAEAMRRVYADRSKWLGDPSFFDVPIAGLTSTRYAAALRRSINLDRATSSTAVQPGQPADFESEQTTHYSVVDAQGNAVATTTTLNGSYGNGMVVPGTGFLLNNEMDDFSAKPGVPNMFGLVGDRANEVQPRKRMLSSMTPTIVTREGRAHLVLGSPGGSRIITTVLQVLMNVVDHGMNVQEAVDAPRFHHQWLPDYIRVERTGFPTNVLSALEARGHAVKAQGDMGDVHAILIDPQSGMLKGASDPRMDGRTLGY